MQIELPLWLDYIEKQIGFILPKNQHQWLINAINGTAAKYELTPSKLFVEVHKNDKIRQSLFDSVLIAESRFFRDMGALAFVADAYKRHLISKKNSHFNVLSVGCSTGQEVWSLAMVLEKAYQAVHSRFADKNPNYHVLGLDFSQTSLAVAKKAHYPKSCLNDIPLEYKTYVDGMTQLGQHWQPLSQIKNKVSFEWCNVFAAQDFYNSLSRSAFNHIKPDVIICQNMLIYFRRFDQRDILGRLVDVLNDSGHLILSAVDGVFWRHDDMERLHHDGANIWQKSTKK